MGKYCYFKALTVTLVLKSEDAEETNGIKQQDLASRYPLPQVRVRPKQDFQCQAEDECYATEYQNILPKPEHYALFCYSAIVL